MSKLQELINELCPDGVEYKKLEECCNILDRKRKPITKSARKSGIYPYYGANGIQDYVSDYIFDGKFILVGEDGSVITPDGKPVVNWAEGKIWVNNHAHIVEENNGVLLRYLYHYIQTVNISEYIHGNIPKFTGGDFKSIKIPVPPLPVQEEIVRTLDKMTDYVTELKAELKARKMQYEYYRDDLLAFDSSASKGKMQELVKELCPDRVEYKTIKSIAEVGTGSSNGNEAQDGGSFPFYVRSQTIKFKNDWEYDEEAIIIPGEGGIGDIYHYAKGKYALHQRVYRIHFLDESINTKFAFYYFNANFKKYILTKAVSATVTSIRKPMIENFIIPVPPLPVQEEIVKILDKFNSICNDISVGLPAEIEARQKQYEYYRDKLLSFNNEH